MTVEQKVGLNRESKDPAALAERLILSYSARQDLEEALQLTELHYDPNVFRTVTPLLLVVSAQAAVGLNPYPLVEKLSRVAEENATPIEKRHILRHLAQVYLDLGRLSQAENLVDQATIEGEYPDPYFHLEMARARADFGSNPQSYLEMAESLAGRMLVTKGIERTPTIEFDPYSKFLHYLQIARTYSQIGLDPEEILSQAREMVETLRLGTRWDHYYAASSSLAEAYADLGYFDRALEFAEKLGGDTPGGGEKMRFALEHLAKEQLAQGDLEGARATAAKTQSHYFQAEILARQAIIEVQNRSDPRESLELAKGYAEDYQREVEEQTDIDKDSYLAQLTIVFALMGEAEKLSGQDPSENFASAQKAAQLCLADSPEVTCEYLLEIARAQTACGIEARETFAQALRAAEMIVSLETTDVFDLIQQAMAYEDIAQTQIACGDYTEARETIGRLDEETKIELLTELAKAQAPRGLSLQELYRLPEVDIKTILAANQPLAEEALRYFRLLE